MPNATQARRPFLLHPRSRTPAVTGPVAEWQVLTYLAADNDLEGELLQRSSVAPQEDAMNRSRRVALLLVASVFATGCVGTAELVRALGDDPNSVCVSVTTIYGKGAACRVGPATDVKAGDGTISVTAK